MAGDAMFCALQEGHGQRAEDLVGHELALMRR